MGLQSTGKIVVSLDCATAFGFVADPLWLVQCVPGCEDLHELSPGRYAAVLSNKVAYITLRFKVVGEIVKIEPPNRIEVKLTGDSVGVPGHLVATAGLELTDQLTDQGAQGTVIRYAAEVALTGKLGGLGQPVFRAKSAELARVFGENLRTALERVVVDTRL
jgi:carbon monoxide dehydrogenase subunit G